ncbi:DUF262 domain-containing protein [Salmonella enterica]|nr:DUF262 domain-containing protein [Salmonella enterica]
MQITRKSITIRELVKAYQDKGEEGVFGFNGELNIRPPYQREFVYGEKQQIAVINSITRGLPLNVMYWVVNPDANYEVLDGQQRTISICRYVNSDFAVDYRYFHNLTDTEKNQILDYELMVYFCEGTDKEKLDWFKTINLAGEKLTEQELRNAVYAGSWLAHAKPIFSKTGCAAYKHGQGYIKGTPVRQDLLEMAIAWISDDNIESYMATHQHDATAEELWSHYRKIINWAKSVFPIKRKELTAVNWGKLYKEYGANHYDPDELEGRIQALLQDEDVSKISGIYPYLLTGNESFLSIRAFTPKMKAAAFTRQKGVCVSCTKTFELEDMEADHITPWSKGGPTTAENCQMLCLKCNRTKSAK